MKSVQTFKQQRGKKLALKCAPEKRFVGNLEASGDQQARCLACKSLLKRRCKFLASTKWALLGSCSAAAVVTVAAAVAAADQPNRWLSLDVCARARARARALASGGQEGAAGHSRSLCLLCTRYCRNRRPSSSPLSQFLLFRNFQYHVNMRIV